MSKEKTKSFFELMREKSSEEKKTIIISERLSDVPFTIKVIGSNLIQEARTRFKTKEGDIDNFAFTRYVCVEGSVEPNFKDKSALDEAGVQRPQQLLDMYLRAGEVEKLASEILKFAGYDNFEAKAVEVENF